MRLVIAEKPSVAADLAKVMGSHSRKDGYIDGNPFVFTWAFGHLLQLAPPESYGCKGFAADHLPIIPDEFLLVPRRDEKGNPDRGVLKQIATIKKLINDAQEVIIATDAGREGELIFRYLYDHIGIQRPLKRLWLASLTDKAIREAFNNLRPASDYDALYWAAKARSEADWLVGINATQGLTVAVKSQAPLSLGRVQTPTLAIICGRYLAHKHFTPEKFFQVQLTLRKNDSSFVALGKTRFTALSEAEKALQTVVAGKSADVLKFERKAVSENPPLLFDLTSLQQEANIRYALSADDTLKAAQTLYESKFITYPRTSSRYIPEDMVDQIAALIKRQENHPTFSSVAKGMAGQKMKSRSVNADKVTDHHALLPTENLPGNLASAERQVYDLIAGRLLESFSQSCLKDTTHVMLAAGNEKFDATGTIITSPGWKGVWGLQTVIDNTHQDDTQESQQLLPEVTAGERLPIQQSTVLHKQTKPKPLHTEASLLKAMETAGKEVEDETLREAMKDKGIGTAATRAAIIETLIKRRYIEKQKKSLVPTSLGLLMYNLVKDKALSSVALTGDWESKFNLIESHKLTSAQFSLEIVAFTKHITQDILNISATVAQRFQENANQNKLPCPNCQSGYVRIFDAAANCSRIKEGCGFVIFRQTYGKKLTDKQITDLILKRRTGMLKFTSKKTGKPFEACLVLDNQCKTQLSFNKT